MPHRLSITAVLALAFTTLTGLAVAVSLVLGLRSALASTRSLLDERAATVLDRTVDRLLGYVQPVLWQSQALAQAMPAGATPVTGPSSAEAAMRAALAATPQIASLELIRPDCTVERVDAGAAAGGTLGGGPECAEIAWGRTAEGLRWVPPFWDAGASRPAIAIQQPLRRGGTFAGVLVSTIALDDLSRFLAVSGAAAGQTPFVLYGRQAVVAVAGSPMPRGSLSAAHPLPTRDEVGDAVLAHLWDPGAEPLGAAPMAAGSHGVRLSLPGGAVSVVYRMQDAGTDQPWIVGTYFRGSLGEAELSRLRGTAAAGLGLLALTVAVTLVIGRWLSRPIRTLAAAAAAVRHDRFDAFVPLPPSPVREFDSAAAAFNRMVEGLRERERIRQLFGRYVAPEVVADLLAQPGGVIVGGERREVTLMFTDIAGFTTLSEQVAAEPLVAMLNAYLRLVSAEIAAQGGIIVDVIGDAVFALFGAPAAQPDHARRALDCARAVARVTRDFARDQAARDVPLGTTRIGVHTGIATVGNFGSDDRLKYGAIGDVVNTASRLEGANKAFGTAVLASGATIAAAGDPLNRPVGRVVLKGKRHALDVCELLSEAPDWLDQYRAAYAALDQGRVPADWADLIARHAGDPVLAVHDQRIRRGIVSTVVTLDEK